MGFHTFPVERAADLEDASRYRYCSREELVSLLELDGSETVADLGSGTGFYTRDVAPFAGTLYAVDVQAAMHEEFRDRGVPDNVEFVTAAVSDLPFGDGDIDVAFSTMTYHEFADEAAFAELARVLGSAGRLVTVDWTAEGEGADGPPMDERFSLADARRHHSDNGFFVDAEVERPETFVVKARR